MRTHHVPAWTLLVVAAAVLFSQACPVGAEDEAPAESPRGQWVYDLRVVKVVGDVDLAARPAPWAESSNGSPVVEATWPDLLKAAKGRGVTTILMDQRMTTVANREVNVTQSRAAHMEVFDRRDQNNAHWKGSVLNEGCQAKLLPGDHVDYEVSVQWSQAQAASRLPLQATSRWRGSAFHFPGKTLVLSHREQVDVGGDAPVTVELWAFVSARWLPAR